MDYIPNSTYFLCRKGKLTNTMLLQPSQCINTLTPRLLPNNIKIAICIHTPSRSPKLNTDDYEPNQPQHEENKGAEDNDTWEEGALRDEVEYYEDKDYAESAFTNPIWEIPAQKK